MLYILLMFDLPVLTSSQRRAYARFHKRLLRAGFSQLQKSIYIQHCDSREIASTIQRRVISFMPEEGSILMQPLPMQSIAMMRAWQDGKRTAPVQVPERLLLA